MDFSLFPVEILEELVQYLSGEDLIACLMVNKQWQRLFDNDIIWRRKCTFHPNYFNKQVTKHRPTHFADHSESKRNFLCELRVENNILRGKYDLERIDIGRLYCDNLVDLVDSVGNHWLFISCSENENFESPHLIKVWNVNAEPTIHQTLATPLGTSKRLLGSQMTVIDNKLFYAVNDTLIAFEFSQPECLLNVLFHVSCPDFEELKSKSAMICKAKMIVGFVHTQAHVVRNAEPWVHVWTEGNTMLYKSYTANDVDHMRVEISGRPICESTVLQVKDSGSLDNVILVYNRSTSSYFSVVVVSFSVKSFQYTTLFIQSLAVFDCFDVVNEIVFLQSYYYKQALLNGEQDVAPVLQLSCCTTDGEMIYQTEEGQCNRSFCLSDFSISNGGKEVLVLDSRGEATVIDVFQHKEICTFKIPQGFGNVGTVIKDNIIIFQHPQKKKTVHTVWDFKYGKRLYHFDELSQCSVLYRFAFNKMYRSPPKIFAIKEPNFYYASPRNGEIVMISFL